MLGLRCAPEIGNKGLPLATEVFDRFERGSMVRRSAQPYTIARNCENCALSFEMLYHFPNSHDLT